MPGYKPSPSNLNKFDKTLTDALGWLVFQFEAFKPNPEYSWQGRKMHSYDAWPVIVPKSAPAITPLPVLIQKVLERTWKWTEPSFYRGNITMGTRGGAKPELKDDFHSYVRPTKTVIDTKFLNKDAIATDWKVFEQIKRTNAVAFRGDTRSPLKVISESKGFGPPISRAVKNEKYYLENNIYKEFAGYLKRRYDRDLTQEEFLRAVNTSLILDQDKKLFVDYMMWRKITERESMHLGRMVENECLKGYISCSRAIDSSVQFGTNYHKQNGWLYLAILHSAFIVPWDKKNLWGSEEAEIAQWGEVKAEHIVGFTELVPYKPKGGPIFIRRSFREAEPKAFEYLLNVISGATPEELSWTADA